VAERQQVPHCLRDARRMRDRHRRDAIAERQQRIDHDERAPVAHRLLEFLRRLFGQDDQRAVGCALHQPFEQRDLARVVMLRRQEDEPQPVLVHRLGNTLEDLREVSATDIRNENAD
jgi:hypothetical protein